MAPGYRSRHARQPQRGAPPMRNYTAATLQEYYNKKHEIDEEERKRMPQTCLTAMLPASIRHLVLRIYYTEPNESGESSDRGVWDDIIELGRRAAINGGPFPNLRQIDIIACVEEDCFYRDYDNPTKPADIWMAAELQRRRETLDAICHGTEIEHSIKRVGAY